MKGWKWGGIVSFSLVSLVYGIIVYFLARKSSISYIFTVLKTYPVVLIVFVAIGIIIGLIAEAVSFFLKGSKKNTRRKKGDVWVSTVLYIALGIVAMTVILSAGIPMINRLKERNTVIETKELMHAFENAVYTVVSEGPGSRRVLDPVIVKGGKIILDTDNNFIRWEMKTKTVMMEPCKNDGSGHCDNVKAVQSEGMLNIFLLKTIVEEEYLSVLEIDYGDKIKLDLSKSQIKGPLVGSYAVVISNDFTDTSGITTVGFYIS